MQLHGGAINAGAITSPKQSVCAWRADLYPECAEFLLVLDFLIWFGLEKPKESSVRQGKFPGTTKSG